MADYSSGMILLAGNSHPELSRLLAERLGIPLGDTVIYNNTSSETTVNIKESVRSKHVFILQTGTKNVNNDVMELLILIYACRTSTAKSITVVIPYLPYSKQCRVVRRSSIAIKLIADLIDKTGACRVVSMDLYKKELQGFFSIPVDNLRASQLIIPYIKQNISDYKNAVIVAKNPDVLPKATSYSEKLKCGIAVIHGTYSCERDAHAQSASDETGSAEVNQTPLMTPPLSLVGDVSGKMAIVVDNIIDEAQCFVEAADLLKSRGAYKVYVVGTHGLLSGDAPAIIENSSITQVIVTNTVPHDKQKMRSHKIRTVDISGLLCEAVRRIFHNESMGILFREFQEL
ncbi:hypothetical protein PFISCL1PPCAC_27531 [Pristionchus fissidentatus]|uniref:Ribose-phosphate pyrophosphokinase N-terminal domain-containing protein n=1 Tax=Pristionchus fissidentatus TaxID=1538716 RepID=A0AAV5X2X6_9BILA|nr:hypothetical protein PFISCL1PPCAC_27531 [Pristionchus fissidentatus]